MLFDNAIGIGNCKVVQYLIDSLIIKNPLEFFGNATETRNLPMIKLFVDLGADVNEDDGAALIESISDLDNVKYLIEKGASYDDPELIKLACEESALDVVEYLVGLGVEIRDIDEMALEACKSDNKEMLKFFVDRGANVLSEVISPGANQFLEIAIDLDLGGEELIEYIMSLGIVIDHRNYPIVSKSLEIWAEGNESLMKGIIIEIEHLGLLIKRICLNGLTDLLKRFLEAGADLKPHFEAIPETIFKIYPDLKLITLLLDNGFIIEDAIVKMLCLNVERGGNPDILRLVYGRGFGMDIINEKISKGILKDIFEKN